MHSMSVRIIFLLLIISSCAGIKSNFQILHDKITDIENTVEVEVTLLKNELSDLREELQTEKEKNRNLQGLEISQDCSCYEDDILHMRKVLFQHDRRHRLVLNHLDNLKSENHWIKQKLGERRPPLVQQEKVNVDDFALYLKQRMLRNEKVTKQNKKRIRRLQKATEKHMMIIKAAFQNEKIARWNNSRNITTINKILLDSEKNTTVRSEIYGDIKRLEEKDQLIIAKISTLTKIINKLKEVCRAAINRS